eukprot:15097-Heterococcus_DN1.PRE.1
MHTWYSLLHRANLNGDRMHAGALCLSQRAADNSWVVTSTSEYDEEILLDWMQHAAQQTQSAQSRSPSISVQHKDSSICSSSSSSRSSSSDSGGPVQQHSVRAPAHDAALTAAHRDSSSASSPVRSDSKHVSAMPASAAAQHASRNSSSNNSNSSNSICVSAGDDWRAIVQAALHSDSDLESAC